MSLKRHATRRDANELNIVRGLQLYGCRILRLDNPDLLVLYHGRVTMLEVKTASGRATAVQRKLALDGWPIVTIKTLDQAIKAITGHPVRERAATTSESILKGLS